MRQLKIISFILVFHFLSYGQTISVIEKFREICQKEFKGIDGCLGVADLSGSKLMFGINKDLLLTKSFKPGSIIKLLTSIAALSSGFFTSEYQIECVGHKSFNGNDYKCWLTGGHGKINFTNAIAQSCNIYFFNIADKLTIENIYNIFDFFSLGKRTPFKELGESPGIYKKSYDEYEKYLLSIGESENLHVTPIQMLYMISVIAKRGDFLEFKNNLNIPILQCIYDGLSLSVKEGTAKESSIVKYSIAGKTGTSTKGLGKKTNSWFIGFAPFDRPEIAIVIFLRYGRGSTDASPIARKVFKSYFNLFHPDK